MPSPTFLLLATGMTAAFILLWYFGNRASAERRRQFQELANSRGWTYQPSGAELVHRWDGPPFTGAGWVTDVFTGRVGGRPFTAFEYGYEEGSGENSVTHRFTVITVTLPAVLPMLWVTPQTWYSQFARRLGSQDIDFESSDFNAAFTVRADDERYAHAVIHPLMMEFLLASPSRDRSFRIDGDTVLMWTPGGLTAPALPPALDQAAQFASLVPSHALQQFQTTAPRSYAGSVAGARPEPTARQVRNSVFLLVWALVWCTMAIPACLAITAMSLHAGWPSRLADQAMVLVPIGFALIGVAVLVIALVRLIRGLVVIRLNKRDRERRGALR